MARVEQGLGLFVEAGASEEAWTALAEAPLGRILPVTPLAAAPDAEPPPPPTQPTPDAAASAASSRRRQTTHRASAPSVDPTRRSRSVSCS